MDVPCETLSKTTRSFVCKNSTSRGGGFFLCFIFRVSKKKRKKRRGEKGRGLCHSLRRACVRSLRFRLPTKSAHHHIPLVVLFEKEEEEEEDDSKRVAQTVLHGALFFCFVSLSLEHTIVAIFKSIQTRAFVLLVLSLTSSSV